MDIERMRTAINEAIKEGVYPRLAPQGSSGTYFVYDRNNREIGVFKPKDEETYAPHNPRWIKYLQRLLCSCCFGRPFLVPKKGYLAEVGAYIVDQHFGFNIVPPTCVMELTSPTFNNTRGRLKPKKGSFQVYVHGYDEASTERLGELKAEMSAEQKRLFKREYQKMCILDYLIRNTDRKAANWLVGMDDGRPRIAAIDNGLSFPTRHPETMGGYRRYPFQWTETEAAIKWDEDLRREVLELMTRESLYRLTKDLLSKRGFKRDQMKVFRGQAWNLRESLLREESPLQLTNRLPILLRDYRRFGNNGGGEALGFNNGELVKERFRVLTKISSGFFGQVYAAMELRYRKVVAIKAVRANDPGTGELARTGMRLIVEQEILLRASGSRHIPELLASGCHGDYSYIVMDLLGRNLKEMRQTMGGKLSINTVVGVGLQVIDALESIHKIGILHRDVKPANLCLGTFENHTNGRVFLIDYNMARTYLDTENNPFPARWRVGFRGTPRYASRNAHRRKEMGPKDDMWSLVYSLLDLVMGSLPWTGLKGKKRIYQAKSKPMKLGTGMEPIAEIMRHLDTKKRTDSLDYNWLKATLQRCAPAWGPDSRYDWQR